MRSAFFGLSVSTQGLYTAQTALDVVNHNISNAEIDGYSRQYAEIKASRPLPNSSRGMVGTGAEVLNIKQYRSTYLDNKYWDMNMDLGEFNVKSEMMVQLELLLKEPSDSGYSTRFADVFDALHDLSIDPGNDTVRMQAVDSMSGFAAYFNDLAEQLTDYQRDANFGVKNTVERINYFADQLASVNDQIENIELNGSFANDLRDERVKILDELSQLINIKAEELEDVNGKKSFKVSINGQVLVDGNDARYLEAVARKSLNNAEDVPDLYDVHWALEQDGNFEANVLAGAGTNVVTVENVNRNDIPTTGTIIFDGTEYDYTNVVYDPVLEQMTFTLTAATPAGITDAEVVVDSVGVKLDLSSPTLTGELKGYVDIRDGNSQNNFRGTISAGAGTGVVTVSGINRHDIPTSGYIKFDGIAYKYESIAYDPVLDEMTFTLDSVALPPVTATQAEIGDDVDYKGIPYYIEKLNTFVRTLAKTFNEIHETGNGGTAPELFAYKGFTGVPPLDEANDFTYNVMNIRNFQINPAILADMDLLATSASANPGESEADIILDFLNIRHDVNVFDQGEPDSYMQSIIAEMAVDSAQVQSFQVGQENLTRLIDNQRESYSSVDLNEETADMIRFQQAYNLSAKMISVMDEIYDVTINQLVR